MFENIKSIIVYKTIDKLIHDGQYESALEKLNQLISIGFKPVDTMLKRGNLCHKLLMTEDAYSDYTYIINNYTQKADAYEARMNLNFEIGNYYEAIIDATRYEEYKSSDENTQRVKFLSMVYTEQCEEAKNYILEAFNQNKYKVLQYLFNKTAQLITEDDLSHALKILQIIDIIDKDNPIKLLKEANIYALGGDKQKESEIMLKLRTVFPKYFISHFRFTDLYEERDLLEICFLLELKIFDKEEAFAYPMSILEGYRNYTEGHITDAKESFEKAITICPQKPEGYVLLAETLQLMSGYKNSDFKELAEKNYKIAMQIYESENLLYKAENMRRQLKHLNSNIVI